MLTIIIIASVFIGVACLAGGVATLFIRGDQTTAVEDRLATLALNPNAPGARKKDDTNILSSPLEDGNGWLEEQLKRFNVKAFLSQADLPWSVGKFVALSLGFGLAPVALLAVSPLPKFLAPIGLVCGVLPFLYAYFKRSSRLSKFAKQLPEALELIARALRAGHSLASGFRLVADECGAPIGTEFTRAYEAQNLGQPLEAAIEEMTERVPNLDLRFFATAVILQRQTGGDLAEILDKIGHLVRERYKIFGQIQALTGEGRLSGVVLLALPPVLAVVMWRLNPNYLMKLFDDPLGHQMLAFAVVSQIIGALVIRKIVQIKV